MKNQTGNIMENNQKNTVVIGSGFSSLSAACFLAKAGHKVSLFEKNSSLGGRARAFQAEGFTFDMGPSWYWMPEVFERFYNQFGHTTSDFYELKRLDPSYRMFFQDEFVDLPANLEELYALFERYEKGSAKALAVFLKQAERNYNIAMQELVFAPGKSIFEILNFKNIKNVVALVRNLSSIESYIKRHFKHPYLRQILLFPILFLGGEMQKTPLLYNFMNHADLIGGTWYPMGGMHKIVGAMSSIAKNLGVEIHTNKPIECIFSMNNKAVALNINQVKMAFCDYVVSGADYAHTEDLLKVAENKNYTDKFWEKQTFSPSAVVFYLGFNRELPNLLHHNLFFDEDLYAHSKALYEHKEFPEKPLLYVCAPSKTDDSVAPKGHENIFVLIPVSAGLTDSEDMRKHYLDLVLARLEKNTKLSDLRNHLVYKESYSLNDFENDYNAYKGNAYGLANTLTQTHVFRPKLQNKRLPNLFYAGQLTLPGPGVPPAIISGEIVANLILNETQSK
jgi:phytoene desaturase